MAERGVARPSGVAGGGETAAAAAIGERRVREGTDDLDGRRKTAAVNPIEAK